MNKLFSKVAALSVGLAMAIGVGVAVGSKSAVRAKAAEVTAFSFARNGTSDSVTSGYEMVLTNYSGKDGYYQDKNTNVGLDIGVKKQNNATIWTDAPTSVSLTVKVGGGSTKDPLDHSVTANLINTSGEEISGTSVVVTTKVEDKNGKNYTVSVPTAANVAGVMVHHEKESSYNIRIFSFELKYESSVVPTTYTVTYNANGGTVNPTSQTVEENTLITTFPTPTRDSYTFNGWQIDGEGEYVTSLTVTEDVELVADWTEVVPAGGTDVLDRAFIGVTGTSYTSWTNKIGTSGAIYAGNSAGGNESIQIRSTNNSGIISTSSAGFVTKISLVWNEVTDATRILDVYGKNTAYSSAADLYNSSAQGTKLGSINRTSNELVISEEVTYIGLRSNTGAMFISQLSITWGSELQPGIQLDKSEVTLSTVSTEGETAKVTAANFKGTPVYEWSTEDTNIILENVTTDTVTIKPNTTTDDSATVTVKVHDNGASVPAAQPLEKSLVVTIETPEPGDDPSTAYTVAEAIAAIDAAGSTVLNNKYVKGVICQIDSYSSQYHSINYWISDDGKTTTKLEAYSGKGLNGADFSSVNDLSLKYSVIIKGSLKKYNSTYEFDKNNFLISYDAPQVQSVDGVASSPESVYVGQSLALTDIVLNVTYVSGMTDTMYPTSISLDTSVAKDNVQGTAYYNELSTTFTIDVLDRDFTGTYVLESNTEDYYIIGDNTLFHDYIDNSDPFTASSFSNFRVGGTNHVTEIMIGSGVSTGGGIKLAAPAGYVITTLVLNGYADNSNGTKLTVGGFTKNIAPTEAADYSYYVFGNSVELASLSRVWTNTITITLEKFESARTLADEFEAAFLDMTAAECSVKAVTEETWTNIANVFKHIEDDFNAAALLVKADDTSVDAIARYKVIVEKYGYTDFLAKGYTQVSRYGDLNIMNDQDNNTMIIVIAIAATSVLSLGLLLVLKKKKHN